MYYDEIKLRICELIQSNNISEALLLINEELNQVYIPKDFEQFLLEMKNEYQVIETTAKNFDIEDELRNLNLKNIYGQLATTNMRMYLDAIQFYFDHSDDDIDKALLWHLLIEQEIKTEFKVNNQILIPINSIAIEQLASFVQLENYVSKLFDKSPDYYEMAMSFVVTSLLEHYFDTEINIEEIKKQLNKIFDRGEML